MISAGTQFCRFCSLEDVEEMKPGSSMTEERKQEIYDFLMKKPRENLVRKSSLLFLNFDLENYKKLEDYDEGAYQPVSR